MSIIHRFCCKCRPTKMCENTWLLEFRHHSNLGVKIYKWGLHLHVYTITQFNNGAISLMKCVTTSYIPCHGNLHMLKCHEIVVLGIYGRGPNLHNTLCANPHMDHTSQGLFFLMISSCKVNYYGYCICVIQITVIHMRSHNILVVPVY